MLSIKDIKINHLHQPKGIHGTITMGWQMESDHKNVRQDAYEVRVYQLTSAHSPNNILYESGKTDSRESANVIIEGVDWPSLAYCQAEVRIWDKSGECSGWYKTGFLTAMHEDQWRAGFITAEGPRQREQAPGTLLRTEFRIDKPVREAFLVSTAQGLYQAYLNGERIGDEELAPGWTSYTKRLLYQTYDITGKIKEGDNALGIMLGAGWYKGDISWLRTHNTYGDYAAFCGQLLVRYEDGSEEIVAADDSWKGHKSPILHADIYDGETYDARLEEEGWADAGYAEEDWYPVRLTDQPYKDLIPQQGASIRIMQEIPSGKIITTPQGDRVIDFGQNLSGWIRFRVQGQAGDEVELQCFETLDAQGNVYTDNLRTAKQTIHYILKGEGEESFQPHFTFQGFRYALIRKWPGQINEAAFTACVLYSDMEQRGYFKCSNPLLNQLQSNILWGLKGNSVGVPTDCPQRDERLGWTGDAQIFCKTACFLMDMTEFYRQWMLDVAADQKEDGGVTHVVPDVLSGHLEDPTYGSSGWGDVAVVMPWVLYQETGDRNILRQQYGSMKAWVDYIQTHNDHGQIHTCWQYGDWLGLDSEEGSYFGATPLELSSLAYHAYTCLLLSLTAGILGKEDDALYYRELMEEARRDFQRLFCHEDGTLNVQTQTAYVLALYCDLIPEEKRERAAKELVDLLKKEDGHLTTGFLGTPYFLHVLSRNGYEKEAYEMLLKEDFPSWLYQVKQGATTVWEHWDGLKPDGTMWSADMNSFNHYAYGAVGQWLYESCAGLLPDEREPGYRHFIIRPHIGEDLSWAEAAHETAYGRAKVRWEEEEGKVSLEIEIPHNTTADIVLDHALKITDDASLSFVKEDGAYKAQAGSGIYRIIYLTA